MVHHKCKIIWIQTLKDKGQPHIMNQATMTMKIMNLSQSVKMALLLIAKTLHLTIPLLTLVVLRMNLLIDIIKHPQSVHHQV